MSLFGNDQQTSQPFGGFSFGAATSAAPTNLTTQAGAAPSLFGTSTPFGGGLSSATSSVFGTTQTAPSFSTSLFPSSSTTTSVFSGLGQPVSSAPTLGGLPLGGGIGSIATGFGVSSLATVSSNAAVTTSVGLGGVDLQAATGLTGTGASNKKDGRTLKESPIPAEITITVELFKKYVKDQKAIREEMSRVSSQNIFKVQELVATLKQQLSVVSNGLHRNAVAIAKLKEESNQELKHAEIAQRTKDASTSIQYESNASAEYFHNLANTFEKQMQSYRQQIEQLERHLLSLSQPYTLTPNEWTAIRKRLHDTFVTLAAQLQTVHQEVQLCKEHFINSQKGETKLLLERQMTPQNGLTYATYGPSPFAAVQSAAGKAITNVFSNSQQLSGGAGRHMMISLNASRISTFQNSSPFKPLGK